LFLAEALGAKSLAINLPKKKKADKEKKVKLSKNYIT